MSVSYKKTKLACYTGLTVQAIINNFLPILFIIFQKDYGLSYEQLGRLLFINFAIQILADFLTPYIVKFIGYKGSAIACHFLASLGLVLLYVLPSVMTDFYSAVVISVVIYAFSSGIIEVVTSPIMELIPQDNKTANMAFLHSFYCWGQALTVVVTTLLVKLLGFSDWRFIPLLWAIIPFFNMFFFMRVPVVEPPKRHDTKGSLSIFKTREFVCFAVFMLCAGANEIAMSEWASVFAQNALGVSKTIGDLTGPFAFAVLMGSGRIIYAKYLCKFSYRKVTIVNSILCFACYLAVAVCKMPVFSLLACAICGFSVSIAWPGTISLAASRFPNGGTRLFSVCALFGDTGCSTGPWILGAVADVTDLNTGFLVCCIFPIIMLLTAIFLLKEKDCKMN